MIKSICGTFLPSKQPFISVLLLFLLRIYCHMLTSQVFSPKPIKSWCWCVFSGILFCAAKSFFSFSNIPWLMSLQCFGFALSFPTHQSWAYAIVRDAPFAICFPLPVFLWWAIRSIISGRPMSHNSCPLSVSSTYMYVSVDTYSGFLYVTVHQKLNGKILFNLYWHSSLWWRHFTVEKLIMI